MSVRTLLPALAVATVVAAAGFVAVQAAPSPATAPPAADSPPATTTAQAPAAAPIAPPRSDAELEALVAAMARTGSAAGAQYSPYGTQIAYHTNISGVSQVWRIAAEGGHPRMVTSGPDAAQGVRWSQDGRLAYGVAPGGGYNLALQLTSIEGTGTVQIDDDGDANTFLGDFAKDGRYHFRSNARDPDSTDAYVWDPRTGTAKLAFQSEGLGGIADLIGDKALAWQLVTRGDVDFYLHDLTTGQRTLLTEH